MQGSLDNPPITLRAKRWRLKIFWELAPGLFWSVFAAAQYFSPAGAWRHAGLGWLVFLLPVLFAYAVVMRTWALIIPPRLDITPTHLVERVGWQRRWWAWDRFRNFRVVPWGNAPVVTFDRPGWSWFGFADPDSPPTGTIQFGYELEPRALADLLNQAHDRWALETSAWRSDVQRPWLWRATAATARLADGGMTRSRFWFVTGVVALVGVAGLSFQAPVLYTAIAAVIVCTLLGRARLRDIGWPQTYSYVVLAVGAYGLVISFVLSALAASLLVTAAPIAVIAPLGFVKSNRGAKVSPSAPGG